MVWKMTKTDNEIFDLSTGTHVMGYIDLFGWAVLKTYVYDKAESIKTLWAEKMKLKDDFEKDLLKACDKRKWTDIQTNKYMQFEELVRQDPSEFPFFDESKGSRYMMNVYADEENTVLTKQYPKANELFDHNNDICQ